MIRGYLEGAALMVVPKKEVPSADLEALIETGGVSLMKRDDEGKHKHD